MNRFRCAWPAADPQGRTPGSFTGWRGQAALAIEGEAYATAWLARLHDGTASPGSLAALMSWLTGEMFHGACRFIEKALEGRSHA